MPGQNKPKSLSTLLDSVARDLGMSDRLDDARVEEAWKKLAGPQAARVTTRVRKTGRTITVYLNDATWRHALHAQRQEWAARLNEAVGADVIDEVVFR